MDTKKWKRALTGIAFLLVIAAVAVVVFSGNDSDEIGSVVAEKAKADSSAEGVSVEQVKDKYENYAYEDFRQLASPARDHSQNGQFISNKVDGLPPAEKLDAMLRYAAEDGVTLVGLSRTFTTGLYSPEQLEGALDSGQRSQTRYEVWSALRDRLTGSANLAAVKLNGVWYNTSVNDAGQVGAVRAQWHDEPGTRFELASVTANGKTLPPETAYMRDLCANRQTKTPPTGMVTAPPTGEKEVPGGVTPPGGGGGTPGTTVTPTLTTTPTPTPEIPKKDTPSNTPGPTGNGKPQPVSETEPSGDPTSPSYNAPPAPGTTSPHPSPPPNIPAPPPGSTSPPASDGGTTKSPTDNW